MHHFDVFSHRLSNSMWMTSIYKNAHWIFFKLWSSLWVMNRMTTHWNMSFLYIYPDGYLLQLFNSQRFWFWNTICITIYLLLLDHSIFPMSNYMVSCVWLLLWRYLSKYCPKTTNYMLKINTGAHQRLRIVQADVIMNSRRHRFLWHHWFKSLFAVYWYHFNFITIHVLCISLWINTTDKET